MTSGSSHSTWPALTLAALGVVYGDIGTSVLYAVKEVFSLDGVTPEPANVLGVLSLIVWTLTVVVTLKYVTLVMRADNRGEGGLVALLTLAAESVRARPHWRGRLLALGIVGTGLFYGDGVITPAISVLSAVEGLAVVYPHAHRMVVPLTVGVLVVLFALQKRGTRSIGRWFGPVMLLWFAVLAVLGLVQIVQRPEILAALSPHHAWRMAWQQPALAFVLLGAVVLCVTGAEALYADMGHFGARPIRIAWLAVVMPALLLNYLGQGALLLAEPGAAHSPFFRLAPGWAQLPLVVLATVATVIASQALITGAFSVTRQVIQLGYLPRLRVWHTSVRETGQIYLPAVNWALLVAVVLAVVLFRSSDRLASAYGLAVTLVMLITTVLTFFVVRYRWGLPLPLCLAATALFGLIDVLFCASNALKLVDGGWFTLLIAAGLVLLMTTWQQGSAALHQQRQRESIGLRECWEAIAADPPVRVDGTAVFLTVEPDVAPAALLHNLKHNKVLHRHNLFVTVRYHELPWIGLDERVQAEPLGRGAWCVTVHFGFKNEPDLPKALELLRGRGIELDPMATSYFLSRDVVVPRAQAGGLALWRKMLFAQLHRSASPAAEFLHLPSNAVVELGSKIEI
ncbi:MAG: potassium transporter Kup [Tepidimonas sp.]|uniref:potassium transporter Kup n=1 Tax=Tepidimonas sp. TaxID=2002775 RepID=UPI00298F3460|nr:potassium transporter Kup [Tepidimonas sp.]MCS6810508.1 potassium transporter Kup [Tepidimonas sp.]MDW8337384.1 potassium transporter Kup [Tepidimonas sp.]